MDLKRTEPSLDLGNDLKSVSNNSGSKMENKQHPNNQNSNFILFICLRIKAWFKHVKFYLILFFVHMRIRAK